MQRSWRDPIVLGSGAVVLVGLLIAIVWGLSDPGAGRDEVDDRETVVVTPLPDSDAVGATLDLQDVSDLSDVIGSRVVTEAIDVQAVPGDEGFWVDAGGESAWVQLSTAGESPYEIRVGQRVRFVGEVVAHGPDFAEQPEFAEADAEALVEAGAHIEVDIADLAIVD
jgi:hypothetical protein